MILQYFFGNMVIANLSSVSAFKLAQKRSWGTDHFLLLLVELFLSTPTSHRLHCGSFLDWSIYKTWAQSVSNCLSLSIKQNFCLSASISIGIKPIKKENYWENWERRQPTEQSFCRVLFPRKICSRNTSVAFVVVFCPPVTYPRLVIAGYYDQNKKLVKLHCVKESL